MPRKIFVSAILSLFILLSASSRAGAVHQPSPDTLFQKGEQLLAAYRGELSVLDNAKDIFLSLVEAYPESPYGYLGLSRYYLIQAYRYDDHYLIPKVKEEVLPYAIKAMDLGPLIPEVHDHYGVIEKIFAQYARHQETLQQYLALFPQQAKTYFLIGELFCDRDEQSLAIESFQKALELSPSDLLKRKILKRLAWIYLEKQNDPRTAQQYYEQALAAGERSHSLYEFLGIAHLRLKDYAAAADWFLKALAAVETPITRAYLVQAQGYLREAKQEDPLPVRPAGAEADWVRDNIPELSQK